MFGEGTIRLLSMNGEEKETDGFKIYVPARELVRVCQLDGFEASDTTAELLHARMDADGEEAFWFFDADKHLAYPEPKFEATLDGNTLTITAQTLIRDIYLNADRVGGQADVGLVTLLPGETWSVDIEGVAPDALDLAALTSRPVLNCANWFGRGA